jgi:acyl-coenzyme A thioesterase PaaI-like protein
VDLETLNQVMTQGVPFNRVLGVRVVALGPARAEVAIPEAPERLNHVGTTHAAVEFALGEAASGAMVVSAFVDAQAQGYVPLAAGARIAYLKPARGDLRGIAVLAEDAQRQVRADLESNGKARFSVPVEIRDAVGTLVAEMVVEWALVKPRT